MAANKKILCISNGRTCSYKTVLLFYKTTRPVDMRLFKNISKIFLKSVIAYYFKSLPEIYVFFPMSEPCWHIILKVFVIICKILI